MIRDILTVSIVSLTLFGSAPDRDGDNVGLQLMAATGDVRRTLIKFLDLYAGLKAGAQLAVDGPEAQTGWIDVVA
mgnify:CR=1 FL=1